MASFEEFWNQYPRKVAKKHAMTMWHRLSVDQQVKAIQVIQKHVDYWNLTARDADKIPHAGSWLNGWRFDDEIEIEQPKQKVQPIAWWASEASAIAKGLEVGVAPRPGEDMNQFKARISEKLRVAA